MDASGGNSMVAFWHRGVSMQWWGVGVEGERVGLGGVVLVGCWFGDAVLTRRVIRNVALVWCLGGRVVGWLCISGCGGVLVLCV